MSQALCQKEKLKGPIKRTPQPNGQMPQAAHSVSAVLQEAQTRAETWKGEELKTFWPGLGSSSVATETDRVRRGGRPVRDAFQGAPEINIELLLSDSLAAVNLP
ncbi:uncharacterized protein LOC128932554 [Callithrix jacchus]